MVKGLPSEAFQDLCQGLVIDDELLKQYMRLFLKELKSGLHDYPSTLNCVVTYVQNMPSGHERGYYLALDVAGVLVRVVLICLKKMSYDLRAKQYNVPTALMMGSGAEFFDFLANCVYEFTKNNKVNMDGLPLGFSFAFPCEQRDIKTGILLEWSKGFGCSGVVGEDVVALLEYSLSKISDLNVNVVAFINDATGTLLSCAWKVRQCKIGIVLDAGTSLCYVERTKHVTKYRGDPNKEFVVINTEYCNIGNDGMIDFLRTGWDEEMDEATLNPGSHICEKMISSLYLGELVRRVLVTGVERGVIFRGQLTSQINTVGAFDTKYLIEISKEIVHGRATRSVLAELGYEKPWSQDCSDLQYACDVVWQRSGDLAAASIAAIVNYLGYPEITVAIDGAFYRAHFEYADHISKRLQQFVRSDIKFRCVVADDGTGLGAALAAAATMAEIPDTTQADSAKRSKGPITTRVTPENRHDRQRRVSTDSSSWKETPHGEPRPRESEHSRRNDYGRDSKYYETIEEQMKNNRRRRSEDSEELRSYDTSAKGYQLTREGPKEGQGRPAGRRGELFETFDPSLVSTSGSRSSEFRHRRRRESTGYIHPTSSNRFDEPYRTDKSREIRRRGSRSGESKTRTQYWG